MLKLNFSLDSALAKIIPPLGPRSVLWVVVVTTSAETGELLSAPDIVSRGFVYMKESEDLLDHAKDLVINIVDSCFKSGSSDWSTLKGLIKKELSNYLYDMTQRSPMILPIIIEV